MTHSTRLRNEMLGRDAPRNEVPVSLSNIIVFDDIIPIINKMIRQRPIRSFEKKNEYRFLEF